MTERIRSFDEKLLAMIVYSHKQPGIEFYTETELPLQVGMLNHPGGHVITTHLHKPIPRQSAGNMEVLYVIQGTVRVQIRDEDGRFVCFRELNKGDILMQIKGGHGFVCLSDTQILEVKQGPYLENDKELL